MVIATSVVFAFLVLIGQLWYLQVLEGGRFLDASDKNRIRVRPIAAPRGSRSFARSLSIVSARPVSRRGPNRPPSISTAVRSSSCRPKCSEGPERKRTIRMDGS